MSLILNPSLYAGGDPDNWDIAKTLTTTPESPGWYVVDLDGFQSASIGSGQLTITAINNLFVVLSPGPAYATRDRVVPGNNIKVSVDIISNTSSSRSLLMRDSIGNFATFHSNGSLWGFLINGTFAFNNWSGTRFGLGHDGTNLKWYVDDILVKDDPITFTGDISFGLVGSYFDGVNPGTVVYENFMEELLVP